MTKYLIACALAFFLMLVGGIVLLAVGIVSLKTAATSETGAIGMIVCGSVLLYAVCTSLWLLSGAYFCCQETVNVIDDIIEK